MSVSALDLALLTNRLEAITRAMMNTLLRSARSGVMSASRDFSCSIVTADDRLLVAGESIPIHVFRGPDLMCEAMKRLHPEFSRGDAFLHNSPYHGNSHVADWCVLVPVFDAGGSHRFTVVAKAHVADTGNSQPATAVPHARDLYEEGALFFPCTRVQRDYEDIEDIVRMCMLRIRVPDAWHGDFRAILGAARTGERKLTELLEAVGAERLEEYREAWFAYSEQRMAAELAELPAGRRRRTVVHDPMPGFPDGLGINVEVEVRPQQGRVVVDLRDNVDNQPFGYNLSEATALSAALIGVFSSLAAPVPNNHGSFGRVEVLLRENCVVGIPVHPASCSMATTQLAALVGIGVAGALAELGEGFGLAESGRTLPASTATISGLDPREERGPFINLLNLQTTGGPASARADGWLTYLSLGSAGVMYRDSVEVSELKYPLLVHEERLLADTEGAGRFRGAPAARVEYGPLPGAALDVFYNSDGTHNAPAGVHGGGPGALMTTATRAADGALVRLPGFGQARLEDGATLVATGNGGGGYGEPRERDPEAVRHDVREGWVSAERAELVYGVALDAGVEIDWETTADLRERMRSGPVAVSAGV